MKSRSEFTGQCDDLAHSRQRVVGVDQEGGLRVAPREGAEGVRLVIVGLDVAVRHGPGDRQTVALTGKHVGGRRDAADEEGSRALERRIDAVHAARPEVDYGPTRGGRHHALRLGGEQGLQMDLVHDERLDELRLGERGHDLEDRLVGEERRTLGEGVHVSREAEIAEPREEALGEPPQRCEIGECFVGEAQTLEIVEDGVEAASEQVVAAFRQTADEQGEDRVRRHALFEVGLRHGQLVEVDEQGEFGRLRRG